MNWDAISAIGESIGAIAVVISLIYLAVQIRQNTRQIKSNIAATELSAFERNIQSGNRMREFFLLNPTLLELYGRGCKSYGELSGLEKLKFGMMVRNLFSEVQGAYVRQQSVYHDPSGNDSLAKLVDENIAPPGVQQFLQEVEPDWRPEFKQFVNDRLEILARKRAAKIPDAMSAESKDPE